MCKTIKQKVRFEASPETIYDLLADSRKRTEVTGRKALVSNKVGGKFSTDVGQVKGVNVDLVPGKRLVQAWRRKDFPEGIYSMAITLAPTCYAGGESSGGGNQHGLGRALVHGYIAGTNVARESS